MVSFDRVQHDVLVARVARKVRDKRLLKLIGRYLRAGVMVDGLCHGSTFYTSQCDQGKDEPRRARRARRSGMSASFIYVSN